jgi:hypothetical protein
MLHQLFLAALGAADILILLFLFFCSFFSLFDGIDNFSLPLIGGGFVGFFLFLVLLIYSIEILPHP